MQVKAEKTFLNSQTRVIIHAGETFDADDTYASDLQQRGIVAPQGTATSATATGAVPQPAKTAAMSGAPFIGSKSVGGGPAPASSSSQAAPASNPKTVVTPPAPKR